MKAVRSIILNPYSKRNPLESQARTFDRDVDKLFKLCQGRVRFGRGGDGDRGENLSGEFRLFTSTVAANTEFSVAHTVGSIPVGRFIFWQDLPGHLYQGPVTGTAWTETDVFFKCDAPSVQFLIFLVK